MATAARPARFLDPAWLGHRSGGLLADLAERFARYRLYRATLNQLAALSDRELADLGVERRAIRDVARKSASEV